MVINLGRTSQYASSGLPAGQPERTTPVPTNRDPYLFGLAPGGVYRATPVTRRAVSSYLTVSPLPVSRRTGSIGGLFSVALSVALQRPAVSRRPALWSSDFPPLHHCRGDHSDTSGVTCKPTKSFFLLQVMRLLP